MRHATDDGLDAVIRLIETHSPELIRGDFNNDQGGCVLHYFGKHHPECKDEPDPGFAFFNRFGGKRLIVDWDLGEITEEELLRVLKHELVRRERKRVKADGRTKPVRV